MYETIRIITKLRPQYVIWENVANLTSKKHRHNLDKYIETLNKLGYTSTYKILNAKDFGIPQDRKRVFVVSILGDEKYVFPLEQQLDKSFYDFLEDDYDVEKYVLKESHLKRVKGTKQYCKNYSFGGKVVEGDIFPTITRCYGRASGNCGSIKCKEGLRALTIRERWRLMGFDDDDFDKASQVNSDTQLKYQAGNSIVVNVAEAILRSLFGNDRIYKHNEYIDNTIKALSMENKYIDTMGNAIKEFWTPNCSFTLMIENFNELRKSISPRYLTADGVVCYNCIKLLEAVIIKFSEERFSKSNVTITLNELTDLFGWSGKEATKDLKKTCKKCLLILKNVVIQTRNNKGPNVGDYTKRRICSKNTGFGKNNLNFVLSKELFELLKEEGFYTYMTPEALKFHKNPNIYWNYKTLLANQQKDTELKIGVVDLYNGCPSLPNYDDVRDSNRQFARRIKEPLEEALNSISCIDWKYETINSKRYKDWVETNIIIKWKVQPQAYQIEENVV